MCALPPSSSRSVESRRTSVDLPEPFCPRIATHSPRSILNVTSRSAGRRRRANRPALRSRRRNTFVRCSTSTAGTSRRTDLFTAVFAASVDMLLLVNRDGTENRENRRARRCARLAVAARDGRAGEAAPRSRVHHVVEQHGSRTIGARSQNVKSRSVRRLVVLVGFARLGSTEVVQPRDDLRLTQQQLDHRSLVFSLAHPTSSTSWMKKIPCLDCPVTCFRSGYSTTSGETRMPAIT